LSWRGATSPSGQIERLKCWLAAVAVWVGLAVIVGPIPRFSPTRVEAGQQWVENDVYTPFALAVEDPGRVAQEESWARAQHSKIFVHDPSVERGTAAVLEAIFADARMMRDVDSSRTLFEKRLRTTYGLEVSPQVCEFLLTHGDDPRLHSDLLEAVRVLYSERGVTNDKRLLVGAAQAGRLRIVGSLTDFLDRPTTFVAERVVEYPSEVDDFLARRAFARAPVPQDWRKLYSELLLPLIRPNLVYSDKLTAESLDAALRRAHRPYEVQAGGRVVAQGDRLSSLQVELLRVLDRRLRYYDLFRFAANALIVAFAMGFVAAYTRRYLSELRLTAANITMLALPTVFALAVARFVYAATDDLMLATFAYPGGLVGMMGVILFQPQLAMIVSLLSALLAGLGLQGAFWPTLVGSASGLAGVVLLYSVRERREVLVAGVRLAVLNVGLAVLAALAFNRATFRIDVLLLAAGNGLGCYVLAVGGLPFIESLFGVVTDVRLMELTSIDHPLMRLLEERAPGSYQHVLNVTKLAEPAAERIGANYLLVRAGAYFHDVGKILKPKYFTENQVTAEERRIHSRLSPHLSCLIIKNHVREGIELARRYRLPEKVIDFIPQHHGTSLIRYFYEQARQQAETQGGTVDEDEFRYPGPKPQTREAAIVMLADAVEAAATAKFTGRTIREEDVYRLVRQTIQDKFSEGQFDECKMTFEDLHTIFEVFVKALLSRFHRRIDYPQPGESRTQPAGSVIVPEPVTAPASGGNS
jgi:putative nucleotidyltransferase with HDIG domain